MIDKFLKIAGVNNIDDFYKLHPTEEHFFKSYPNAKKQIGKKLSQAAYGGYYQNGGMPGMPTMRSDNTNVIINGPNGQQFIRKSEAPHRMYEQVMANAMEKAEAAKLLNAPKESVSVTKAKAYQKMLNDKYGAGLVVDGIIGKNTKKAIEKFINYKQEVPVRTPTKYASQRGYGMMARPSEMGELEEGTDITPLPMLMGNDRVRGMRLNQQQPYSYPVEPETDLTPLPTVMGNEGYGNGMRIGQPQMEEEAPRQNRIYRGRPANPQYDEETYKMGGYYQDGGETDQQQQIMQIIQAYAQVLGQDPQELVAQLQKLQPEEQQAAIQSMMQELQQGQLQKGENEQQEFARGGMTMGVREAARHIMNSRNRSRKQNGGYYQMGGEAQEQPQQEMQESPQMQGQEQAMGQEQQGGGQEQMMQQLAQMVAQALQQGMQPEQIMQMLIKQGVPQEVAMQVIQMVMQQMQGAPQGGAPGQQYQPQGGQYQGSQGQQPMAAMGGYYANGGINNPGFRALPSYVQQKIMNNMAYGGHYDNGGYFNESYMPFDY